MYRKPKPGELAAVFDQGQCYCWLRQRRVFNGFLYNFFNAIFLRPLKQPDSVYQSNRFCLAAYKRNNLIKTGIGPFALNSAVFNKINGRIHTGSGFDRNQVAAHDRYIRHIQYN